MTSPVFWESKIDEKIQEVESEHHRRLTKNYNVDDERILAVLQAISNKGHVFNRFCWGSEESLRNSVQDNENL